MSRTIKDRLIEAISEYGATSGITVGEPKEAPNQDAFVIPLSCGDATTTIGITGLEIVHAGNKEKLHAFFKAKILAAEKQLAEQLKEMGKPTPMEIRDAHSDKLNSFFDAKKPE